MLQWIQRVVRRWLRKRLRNLECKGKHSTSVLSDGTCHECGPIYELLYPRGWNYYPGDCCEHGTYVGGCGIDYMCHPCEMGDGPPPVTVSDVKRLVIGALRI